MIIYLLISILTGFFIGYNLGYNKGKKTGLRLGLKETPLLLLEESLKKGYCLICNNKKQDFLLK